MSNDLHTYIEPELEARITALVLGEVGEFDVDELERIIQEQPELQIFRRRMEAMHDLLGETVKSEKDENWQLSGDRRAELRRTFSKKPESTRRQSSVITRTQWRSVIGIAACLAVSFVLYFMRVEVSEDRFTTEVVSYQAAYEEDLVPAPSDKVSDDRLFRKEAPASRSSRRSRVAVVEEVVAPPALGLRSAGKKKASKESSIAHHSLKKRSMARAIEHKPSALSSSMAKVIASNTSSDTAIPVPEMDEPDPSVAFGDGDDFGDGWGDGESSGAFGSRKMAKNEDVDADAFKFKDDLKGIKISGNLASLAETSNFEAEDSSVRVTGSIMTSEDSDAFEGFTSMDSPITSGKDTIHGGSKYRASGRSATFSSGVEVIREFNYPTEYEPPEPPNSIAEASKLSKDEKSGFPVTPETRTDSIAQKEIARRSSSVKGADEKLMLGRDAYSQQNYQEAAESYREALAQLPPGPTTDDRRRSYQDHLGDANVALAQKYRRIGKYDEARKALEETLSQDPANFAAKKQLSYLDDPIRKNSALTLEGGQNVDKVRRHLYMGEGYYNLGQYDKAEAEFKKVLLTDKFNKASRRWLEKVAATQSDYYRAAYDHTRASLLAEVDKAWEMEVPADQPSAPRAKLKPAKKPASVPMSGKLAVIKGELDKKNDHLAELRSRLMDVAEKSGVIYWETEKGDKAMGNNSGLVEMAEKELYQAERDREQLTFQINKLLALDSDELVTVVSDLPDVGYKEYYNEYVEAKRDLQVLMAGGHGENHPDVLKSKKAISELEVSLEKRAINVRDSLKHNLSLLDGRVKKMQEVVNSKKVEGANTARDIQEFNIARKEYQTALAIRDAVEVKFDRENAKAVIDGKMQPTKPTIPSPKRPEPLPEETNTSAQPFSTFSLNVSDVSFKLAKVALLEKGQWPESSKVRTEEFVNAFDYGDPSPRRGESVACAIEQSTHPFLQQRNLLRIGMKTAALGRSNPLRLTVLLDNSGSMEREDREASVLAAIRVLAAQLGPQDKITLVGFARTPRLLADRISGDQAGKLVNIVANTPSEGGTNIEEALLLARKLAKRQHTEGAQDRIVLITDGVANLGNTVPEELSRQIEIMRQDGIAFDACGVGAEGLNDEILEAMTRKGDGRYYFLNRPEDADSGFAKQLAGALSPAAKNVKVQVVFNPKRVSKYRLLGFNKHRLNKEDFRNDQVDAAEMAAEEAGNAVYQIEVNPNGEGELGEVFVRFLDANMNRMVERSWPLAYESQVKAFDLTTPSMRLAGVASQLGEKLHGTDAGSVRFQNISNTLGSLRAHYSHNQKVQDLIRMCEKVK